MYIGTLEFKMPKKGNPADYNSSIFSPRLLAIRPKLFKENRLQLFEIIKDAEKGRKIVEAIFSQVYLDYDTQICNFSSLSFYCGNILYSSLFFLVDVKKMFNLFGIYLYIYL